MYYLPLKNTDENSCNTNNSLIEMVIFVIQMVSFIIVKFLDFERSERVSGFTLGNFSTK